MGRVYAEIKENGRNLWTIFDTGSRNTYITRSAVQRLPTHRLSVAHRAGLGGKIRMFEEVCFLDAFVEGKHVSVKAFVTDELSRDENGRTIEVLFGAIEMQNWGIVPIPQEERLDLSRYPEEFIEF